MATLASSAVWYSSYKIAFLSQKTWIIVFGNCREWCKIDCCSFLCINCVRRQFIYIFIYFMKIWRIKKSKSCSVAYCACMAVFLARVIVTWIHFLLNGPKEFSSIDRDVRKPFLNFFLFVFQHAFIGKIFFITLQGQMLQTISYVTVVYIYNDSFLPKRKVCLISFFFSSLDHTLV